MKKLLLKVFFVFALFTFSYVPGKATYDPCWTAQPTWCPGVQDYICLCIHSGYNNCCTNTQVNQDFLTYESCWC